MKGEWRPPCSKSDFIYCVNRVQRISLHLLFRVIAWSRDRERLQGERFIITSVKGTHTYSEPKYEKHPTNPFDPFNFRPNTSHYRPRLDAIAARWAQSGRSGTSDMLIWRSMVCGVIEERKSEGEKVRKCQRREEWRSKPNARNGGRAFPSRPTQALVSGHWVIRIVSATNYA